MKQVSLLLTVLIAIFSILSIVFLWKQNLLLLTVLIFSAVLMLLIKKSKAELKTFIFCGVSGAIAESVAIRFGAWTYHNPDVIGIPIWLPVLWGIASVFIVRIYMFFRD